MAAIEEEVHLTVTKTEMFKNVKKLVIGVSGGKDSTVLAHIMHLLNQRHEYGLDLHLLCVDEGISGYRDKSIQVVRRNEKDLGLPLTVISYKESIGQSLDEVSGKIGKKEHCTFCGVFRRSVLEDGAKSVKGDMIATGHNADDTAETLIMNYLRGDIHRLLRSTQPVTGNEAQEITPRCKPLLNVYEKEIVMYAFYKDLPYFSTECKYASGAFRGTTRTYIKTLEKVSPKSILKIISSGDSLKCLFLPQNYVRCSTCNRMCSSSNGICKACTLKKEIGSI